ncbi:MAG: SdiA-regulated domain-containing protein, partial [Candidatus Lokiarchaeia archaeon]|nr:SdiA-regulated domain-containing protein [Candidatus Lokiarchaeia archaeon]
LSGQIIRQIRIDVNDLEGICVVSESLLAVVSEETNELLIVDYSGKVSERYSVILDGDINYGLEGVTYNNNLHQFYLVKEKSPSLLLDIDSNFKSLTKKTLNFSKDLSGIEYDSIENILWILSDESQTISKCDLTGNVLQSFHFNVSKPEGIAIDYETNLIYIVSDSQQKLFIYKIPK